MDGLLLSGGADVDPSRYGVSNDGSRGVEPERDELEAAAWAAAEARGLPVLGICRGLQAMNVFAGGQLLQHVDDHAGPGWGHGPAHTHPMRLVPGTRLARILSPTRPGAGVLTVNSYHHQAVRPTDLAPVFTAAAVSHSAAGELVEGLEARSGPFRMAVQCHPERTEFDARRLRAAVRVLRGRLPGTRGLALTWRLQPAGLDDPVEELSGPGLAGLREHPGGRPLLQDPALVEEADAVRDVAGEAHLVGRDQHRHPARAPAPG